MVYIDYSNADKIEELGTVWINGEEFKGIGYNGLLTVNTKTYVSEPTRANDGSMPNIGDHETFIVPRCKINFKYLNVNDYRRLCNAILPNEFLVKYYDKDFGDFVEHWMYCEPQEMAKIYNIGTAVIGVLDYEVSFIGTRNKPKELTVQYDKTAQTIKADKGTFSSAETYKIGDRVLYISDNEYYEAVFYEDTFVEKPIYNSNYWSMIDTPTEWTNTGVTYYGTGAIVFVTKTSNGKTIYTYYESQRGHYSSMVDIGDKDFWKVVNIEQYSTTTTYTKGDYVYTGTEGITGIYYKAIYYSNSFSNKLPTDTKYWKKLKALSPMSVGWGQSLVLADPMDLFVPEEGKTSADKWQVILVKNGTDIPTTNYYYANQSISILRDMKLKPVWKDLE